MKCSVGDLVKWEGINGRGRLARRTGVVVAVVPRNEVPKVPDLFKEARAVFGNELRVTESYLILSEGQDGRRYLYWPRPNLLQLRERQK